MNHQNLTLKSGQHVQNLNITRVRERLTVEIPEGETHHYQVQTPSDHHVRLSGEQGQIDGWVKISGMRILVVHKGRQYILQRVLDGEGDGAGLTRAAIEAPMTGTVREVLCRNGDQVEEGTALLIVEAMKMEHRLVAPQSGVVSDLVVSEGEQVDVGQVLVRVNPEEEPKS